MHSHAGADISPVSADVPTKSFPSSLPCTTMLAGVAANIVGNVLLPKCFGIYTMKFLYTKRVSLV